ncbi:hypothetical protein E2F50_06690 [Rhizobium deserti]|uniref:Uncharacterized protein n=1 Tax=Rhizobium deserti TaxID=2547961 RepID=A0A4R5UIH3_9HYPH|nr:hypothetical protein [Rhizobium deserti]TDK36610.1 hypothetical protein E2F50_06690 [Rhizobium deserti]
MDEAGKPWSRHKADSLEEIARICTFSNEPLLLVESTSPDAKLLVHLADARIPVLIAAPHFLPLLAIKLQAEDGDVLSCWRQLSEETAVLITAAANEAAIIIRPADVQSRSTRTVSFSAWELAEPTFERAASFCPDSTLLSTEEELGALHGLLADLPPEIMLYCQAMEERLLGRELRVPIPVTGLVLSDDFTPFLGDMEVVGEPRGLLCGPFVRLPTGSWTVRVAVEVSESILGAAWVADVFVYKDNAGVSHARLDGFASSATHLEVSMSFVVQDPHDPYEFRFALSDTLLTKGTLQVASIIVESQS